MVGNEFCSRTFLPRAIGAAPTKRLWALCPAPVTPYETKPRWRGRGSKNMQSAAWAPEAKEAALDATSCSLLLQLSRRSRCTSNTTFGCAAGALWIRRGCRGQFLCNGAPLQCGYENQHKQSRDCSCAADKRNWHLNTQPAALRRAFGSTKVRGCTADGSCVHRDALASFCPRANYAGVPPLALWGAAPSLVIDVGSHDGVDALSYARAGHRVLSFEASPAKVIGIQKRLRGATHGSNVTLIHAAASDHSGNATLWVHSGGGEQGSEQDGLAPASYGVPLGTQPVTVPATTLDESVAADEPVLYLKVDAQGHDPSVLRGARQLLRERRVLVLAFEVTPSLAGGVAMYAGAVERLGRRGYACFNCACEGVLGLCNPVLQPLGSDVGRELERLERLANRTLAQDSKLGGLPFWTDFLCTPMESWGA